MTIFNTAIVITIVTIIFTITGDMDTSNYIANYTSKC